MRTAQALEKIMMINRNLLITVLAGLLGYGSVAQRVTDISVTGSIPPGERLRLTPASGGGTDTSFNNIFTDTKPGQARITLPAPMLVNFSTGELNRQLMVAPGFNLSIRIHDSAGLNQLVLSGPGARLNEEYEAFNKNQLASYNEVYAEAQPQTRIQLMSEKLKLTDKINTRQLRDYFSSYLIGLSIDSSADVFQLNENKIAWQTFFTAIAEPYYKNTLDSRYNSRLDSFLTAMNGRPAPDFALYDPAGKRHNFSEMAGKVIYIDFWASWCAPCRVESGNIKKLKKEYASEKDLVFVGIAIADINWKRAILEDQPDWLQLRDANGKVAAAYGVAGLPRYVLIGKDGKVADHNAPAPGNKAELKIKIDKLLKQ